MRWPRKLSMHSVYGSGVGGLPAKRDLLSRYCGTDRLWFDEVQCQNGNLCRVGSRRAELRVRLRYSTLRMRGKSDVRVCCIHCVRDAVRRLQRCICEQQGVLRLSPMPVKNVEGSHTCLQ